MKTLKVDTGRLICKELESLPEKYAHKDFNSTHEGYAVILEEVRELENEVFFGWKRAKAEAENIHNGYYKNNGITVIEKATEIHNQRMREECIQIAAMCARFIQELT